MGSVGFEPAITEERAVPVSTKDLGTVSARRKSRKVVLTGAFAGSLSAAMVLAAGPVHAADSYPSKPIRIVCPFPPGGGADAVARILGDKLSARTGNPVIIDNRAGAGGAIGAGIVAKAEPNGYTLLLGSSSVLATGPALQGRSYQAVASEFSAVSLIGKIAYVLVTHPSIPANSVAEFIRYAASSSERINYASSGVGTASHLAMELFKSMARIDLLHVPFKGSSPAVIALIGGQVQTGFNNMVPVLPHIRSGRLRALGVSGPRRWSGLPDVPTIAASGLPGYEALQWYGVVLPFGTPRAIADRLHDEIGAILQMPEVREHLSSEGGEVIGSTPEELARYMEQEIAKWTKVVKAANIRAD